MERHARSSRASPASGGRVTVANAVRWSRLAPPAPVMAYTFDVAPVTDAGGVDGVPGARLVYVAEIEVRVPVPIPARARAAVEDAMVDSFDVWCDRFIRYAAAKVAGCDPVLVRGVSGGDDERDGAPAPPPTTTSPRRAASADASGRRRVVVDVKGEATLVDGDVFYVAREE